MPKFNYAKNNFSIGELSPKLHGRSDTASYTNGADTLTNVHVLVGGGVTRRPGMRYQGAAKHATNNVRYVPFVTSSNEYLLEFGNLYMRVWKNGAVLGAPYELTTPYAIADVHELSVVQNGTVLYIAHNGYQLRKIVWASDTSWSISTVAVPILLRPYGTEQITITPSAATGSITLTASSALFTASWVGQIVKVNGGYVTITAYTNPTTITGTVAASTSNDGLIITEVDIASSSAASTVSVKTVANYACKLFETEISIVPYIDTIRRFVEYSGDTSKQISSSTIIVKSIDRDVKIYIKTQCDTYSKTPISQTTTLDPSSPVAGYTYVGPYNFPINGLEADYGWTVQMSAFFGWPRCVTIHEQRLWLGGNSSCPHTVWSSKVGDLEDFTASTLASGACIFTISGNDVGDIKHMVSSRVLEVYTTKNEVTIEGSETGIKPNDVQVKQRTVHGSGIVAPVRVGADTFFATRGLETIRQNVFTLLSDQYESNEVTALAEHITSVGISNMAYHRQDKILFITLTDGTWATVALDTKQGLQGWSAHTTASGLVKSIVSLPAATGDVIYLSVLRNGVMTLEKLDSTLNTDSAVTGTSIGGTASWSGYSHLNALSVDVIADSAVQPRETVSGGSITLARNAYAVEAGLPYTSTIIDLPVDVQGGGTIQGSHISVNEVTVRMLDTKVCKVNGQVIAPRQFTVTLDSAHPATTGTKDIHLTTGWLDEGQITITQDVPATMTILGVYKKVSVND